MPTLSTPHSAVGAEVVLPASHRPPVISGSVPEPVRVTTPNDIRSSEALISGAVAPISGAVPPTATPVRVPSTAVAVPTSLPQATETSTPTVPPPVHILTSAQVLTQSYPSHNWNPPDYSDLIGKFSFRLSIL